MMKGKYWKIMWKGISIVPGNSSRKYTPLRRGTITSMRKVSTSMTITLSKISKLLPKPHTTNGNNTKNPKTHIPTFPSPTTN
jgi:hypothetical protein